MSENLENTKQMARFGGVERLYGQGVLGLLQSKKVMVIGIGGVGSWAAEALARTGIGEIQLVDMDEICITNTNRQSHTTVESIGKSKVEIMKQRLQLISPEIKVEAISEFFTSDNVDHIFSYNPDIIIDAFDSLQYKCLLYKECKLRNIPLIVSGGSAGKIDPSQIQITDMAFTINDMLLKRMRKRLRDTDDFPPEGVASGTLAISSKERAHYVDCDGSVTYEKQGGTGMRLDCYQGLGSATYVTGAYGFAAASAVIKILAADKIANL